MSEDQSKLRRVGGFELLHEIGEGGMGTVWKARQISLDRIVALKLLSPEFSQSTEFIGRFRNEARAAALLTHRHIVQVYDAGKADDANYLAMEFIEGKTVHALVQAKGKMGETEALDIVLPVAMALRYAFERAQLIHRDVKPENILIDRDGVVKLCDLGLAKIVTGPDSLKLTRSGMTLGTPFYISPEQAEGRDLDARSDVYGLGATLYHMVTGHAPFEDAATAVAMMKQVKETVPDARQFQPQLSAAFCMVIEKMMAKDRRDRYQNWAEVISDLQLVRIGRNPVNARVAPNRSTMLRRENAAPGGAPARAAEAPVIVLETKGIVITPMMWVGIALIVFFLLGSGVLFVLSGQREGVLRAELETRKTAARADAAARAYYEAVEFARTHPLDTDDVINRFKRVQQRYPETDFAEEAADQSAQWEKRRDEVRKQRARQESVTRNKLATAARREAEARFKAEKAEAERKAAQAVKAAEEKRRAAEEAARARQNALAAYFEFCPSWQALLARRDYAGALLAAQAAEANPDLAPQKQLLAAHVAATQRISSFVARLLAADSPLRGKSVTLSRITGTITAVTAGRNVTIEKIAGVGATMPVLMLPPDDFLKLAAVALKAGNEEDQINGALLTLAEGRPGPANAVLQNANGKAAEPFKQMMTGIAEAQAEREAVAMLGDLRTQLDARQWPTAFANLTALDTRYTNTVAVAAAGSELAAARDQLLAAPATAVTVEPAARLAITEIGRAADARNWKRALAIFATLDALQDDATTSDAIAPATFTEIETLRRRLAAESGLAEAAALGDIARRRAIQKAGGYIWTVKADGGGNSASLQEALAKADDGDAIELDGGAHVVSKFDGSGKQNIVIYGRGGTLPIITDATVGGTNTVGGFVMSCGDNWQLDNLHFEFSSTALYQRGTNLTIRGCVFSRPFDPRRSGVALFAECNADWRLTLNNCLIAAPDSDALQALPYRDTAPRYAVEMNHCTLWMLAGTVFNTGRRAAERHFTFSLRNSVVVAQRIASTVWTRELMRSGLTYAGDRNLAYVVRYADETPTLGDENWKELFPGQDAASSITPVTYASLTALRRGRHAPAIRDFISPSAGDLRLASDSGGVTLSDDGAEAGVRWPSWRWEQYLKNAAETTPSELAESGALLSAIVPPVLTESQRVQAAQIPLAALFQGAVRELSDGRIELQYDFAGTNQLADWHVIGAAATTGEVASLPSFAVASNTVRKVVPDLALLAHRARFKGEVVLQFNAAVEKGAVVAGVLSFPNERFAAVADLSSGLRIVSREPGSFDVITNLNARMTGIRTFPLIVGTEGNKLVESVPDIGILETTLPRARAVCEVALAADRTLARFSQVRLTGALDTNWLAVARAIALLGPDAMATNAVSALPANTVTNPGSVAGTNAPSFASLTQQQQLKASQIPVVALFKGEVKELGGDKYEWTYDLSKPEHRADWETDTPAAWVAGNAQMSRQPGAAKPLWFRARLRGNFTVSWRAQTTGGGACQLALRYVIGDEASWTAVGLGTFSAGTSDGSAVAGFGIGKRSASSRVLLELTRHPYSPGSGRATLAFYCSQTGDLLRAQVHRRDVDQSPVRAETRLSHSDTPVTLGFDGDSSSQFDLSDIHITGAPDPEWVRVEQARVLLQTAK